VKNNARPFRRIVSILFFSVVAGFGLSAEVQISLTPPGLMPGLTGLEDMFEDEVVALTDEINETLSDSIDKPLFMQGFGGAAATSVLVPHAVRSSSVPSVHFGIDVSVYAEPLASDIAIRLKNLDADSDERMGACMQPFVVSVRVPLDRFYPGLYGGGNFGYMNTLSGDYRMRAIAAGLSAGYRLKGSRFGVFFWDGISVEAGADYSSDRITASFSPGSVSETITLDEDGDGPLPAFDAALTFDPEVTAGVDLSVLSFSIQASSGVTVIEAVSLFAGVTLGGYISARRMGKHGFAAGAVNGLLFVFVMIIMASVLGGEDRNISWMTLLLYLAVPVCSAAGGIFGVRHRGTTKKQRGFKRRLMQNK